MILDFEKDKSHALENGIVIYKGEKVDSFYFAKSSNKTSCNTLEEIDEITKERKIYRDIIFKNFPNIILNNAVFIDCQFENCLNVDVCDCVMINCYFQKLGDVALSYNKLFAVLAQYTLFESCVFCDSSVNYSYLTMTDTCKVENCKFENIYVGGDDGHICRMSVDKKKNVRYLQNCKFINCSLENQSNYLSLCKYDSFFLRDCEIQNLDEKCEIINN